MPGVNCRNWFDSTEAVAVGTMLAACVARHELREHDGAECKDARVEMAAFILHVLKVEPREVERVRARMLEHIRVCDCGEGREAHR